MDWSRPNLAAPTPPTDSAPRARVLGLLVLLILLYAWLCISWFDHELEGLRWLRISPAIILTAFLSVAFLCWRACRRSARRRRVPLFAWWGDPYLAFGLMSMAVTLRVPFLAGAYGLFSSDSSVQGVMALHILEGRHHPIFLYRWSYVGSVKAHLTALLSWLTGEPVLAFLLAALLVYAAYVGAVYFLSRVLLSPTWSAVSALFVVVSSGFLTAWGLHNEGNYLDVLFLGTWSLAVLLRWVRDGCNEHSRSFIVGILVGLAFWIHILATYYWIAAAGILAIGRGSFPRSVMALVSRLRGGFSRLAVFALGFVVGDFPGILWNAAHEWLSFRWWSVDASQVADEGRIARTAHQFGQVWLEANAVLSGYWPHDLPPAPSGFWRTALVIPIPAVVLVYAWTHRRRLAKLVRFELTPESVVLGFFALVVSVFSVSSFGWLSREPRYLLFVFSVLPVFVATAASGVWRGSKALFALLAIAILYVHLHGSAVYLKRAVASADVNRQFLSELMSLDEQAVRFAQTDYHISYKYVFLSHGRLVWTSELGPAQTEWYTPYREEVALAERVALVPRSYRLARRITRRLDAQGISYERRDLLYPVIFNLSRKVRPQDLR